VHAELLGIVACSVVYDPELDWVLAEEGLRIIANLVDVHGDDD
jgi:hypothetical protein